MRDSLVKPELTVAAIAQDRDRYLLVEELVNGNPVLNQPAGHVEPHESLLEAVVRETLEETGWHFQPKAITGIYLWTSRHSARQYIRVCFCGTVTGHDAWRKLDSGIVRALWMSRPQLATRISQLRSTTVMRGIEDFESGHRYPLDLVHDLDIADPARKIARIDQPG